MKLNEEQTLAVRHPLNEPACLIAGAGSGKLQPLDSLVLGRYGWKRMGDLRVGEIIIDPTTGLQMRVTKIHPHPPQEVYRLTFDDGASCEAGKNHLWAYYLSRKRTKKRGSRRGSKQCPDRYACRWDFLQIGDTDELRTFLKKGVRIPLTEPVCHSGGYNQWRTGNLSPYAIGLYLGDGTHATLEITNTDREIRDWILQRGGRVRPSDKNQLLFDASTKKALRQWIHKQGLTGNRSWEKFLPEVVFTAPLEFRKELLQGLLDSDGWSSRTSNNLGFSSSSRALSEGVQRLVWSLGGWASLRVKKKTTYTYKGKKLRGRKAFVLSIKMPLPSDCFKLTRKKKNCKRPQSLSRELVSIKSVGIKPVQCITVDSIHGLYVTNDYIVTHNTATMTARVKWLIEQGIKPRRIAVITFTNRAAGELVARIGVTDPNSPDSPRVSTIHSLALSAIRKNPLGFGLQARVSPLDDYDQTQMMKKIIEREKIADTNPYAVLEKIQFHRARGVGFVVDYTSEVAEEAERMYSGYHLMTDVDLKLWDLYQLEKTRTNVLDFDDMILLCNRRFASDGNWRSAVQRMWDHVLVDEVQDISKIQWQFIEGLLAPDNSNLFVVGDLNQSIYSFTGAAPYLLKQYSENWRGKVPRMYKIVRNHRSVPEVVNLANLIQSKMGAGCIPLKMESWRGLNGQRGSIEFIKGVMARDVAANIAVEIFKDNEKFLRDEHMKATGGTPRVASAKPIAYRENCILVRAAIQIRDIEGELVRRRIPYIVRGGRGLLQTEEVRDVLAYMRLTTNHKDFMAFVRSAQVPRRGCGEVALEKIRTIANTKFDGDLIEAAKADKNAKITSFGDIVGILTQFSQDPVRMLEQVLSLTQYKTYIGDKYKSDSGKVKTKLENLDRFASLIEGLAEDGTMTTEDMIFQLTLDRPKDDDESGAVTISTIHSAKGLEWKRVYVANLVEGSLPHKFSMGNDEEIEEERRLFYVACTRARDYLLLCVPGMLQQGPNTINLRPSRFLAEIQPPQV